METKQSRSAGQNNNYYVYIVKCADQTFYTGITNDLKRRVGEHNSSDLGAKYTRGRRPVCLIYSLKFKNRSLATKEECRIKKLTKKEKLGLIN
jgi:putative endonuclease